MIWYIIIKNMPSKKAKTQAPPEPVVEVVEVVENNEIEDSLEVKFTEVLGKLAAFRTIVKEMEKEVKKLQKSAQKEISILNASIIGVFVHGLAGKYTKKDKEV